MTFKEVVSDDQLLNTIEECLEESTISLSCISEKLNEKKLGIGKMRLRERLAKLENEGKVKSKKVGTGLGYRPKTG
jgi:predicted ArsR family transcriptional regulator